MLVKKCAIVCNNVWCIVAYNYSESDQYWWEWWLHGQLLRWWPGM